MNFFSFNQSNFRQDSLINNAIIADTIPQESISIPPQTNLSSIPTPTPGSKFIDTLSLRNKQIKSEKSLITNDSISSSDTTIFEHIEKENTHHFNEPNNFFSYNIISDSFDYKYNEVYINKKIDHYYKVKEVNFIPHHYHRSQLNWTLIIGLLSIVLLLSIKAYYQKFLQQVINTLFNFQLADKMFKEKNILLRRAFFFLNVNFIIIISLFILLLSITFEVHISNKNYLDYFIILSVVVAALILRYMIFYLTGKLFQQLPVVLEYIHNKYLFNKNIGIALIPIVFTSLYVSPSISKILLIICVLFIILITVYKIFRGFQIFLKNGILLFYTILYLCTLELLPLVLGSKIISTLR